MLKHFFKKIKKQDNQTAFVGSEKKNNHSRVGARPCCILSNNYFKAWQTNINQISDSDSDSDSSA